MKKWLDNNVKKRKLQHTVHKNIILFHHITINNILLLYIYDNGNSILVYTVKHTKFAARI